MSDDFLSNDDEARKAALAVPMQLRAEQDILVLHSLLPAQQAMLLRQRMLPGMRRLSRGMLIKLKGWPEKKRERE